MFNFNKIAKNLVYVINIYSLILFIVGSCVLYILFNATMPQIKEMKIKHENLNNIHSPELNNIINNGITNTVNYNGIKFTIEKNKNLIIITVDTNNLTIDSKQIKSEILNKTKALGTINCFGLTEFNSDIKEKLLDEKFLELKETSEVFNHGKPQNNSDYKGYIFPLTQKNYNIYWGKQDKYAIFISDPNISIIEISIAYDVSLINKGLASETTNYIRLK